MVLLLTSVCPEVTQHCWLDVTTQERTNERTNEQTNELTNERTNKIFLFISYSQCNKFTLLKNKNHLITGQTEPIAQKQVNWLILNKISSKLPRDRSDEASQVAEGGKEESCADSSSAAPYIPFSIALWLFDVFGYDIRHTRCFMWFCCTFLYKRRPQLWWRWLLNFRG